MEGWGSNRHNERGLHKMPASKRSMIPGSPSWRRSDLRSPQKFYSLRTWYCRAPSYRFLKANIWNARMRIICKLLIINEKKITLLTTLFQRSPIFCHYLERINHRGHREHGGITAYLLGHGSWHQKAQSPPRIFWRSIAISNPNEFRENGFHEVAAARIPCGDADWASNQARQSKYLQFFVFANPKESASSLSDLMP